MKPADTVASLAAAGRVERGPASSRSGGTGRPPVLAGVSLPGRDRWPLIGGIAAVVVVLLAAVWIVNARSDDDGPQAGGDGAAEDRRSGEGGTDGPEAEPEPETPTGLAAPTDYDGWVDPASFGQPWSSEVLGQLTFRGNPTRSYHGLGPVPGNAEILWRYPGSGGLCGPSTVGGETTTWCGTGWTGQPSVWVDGDRTWVGFGAYDHGIHFLDAADGTEVFGSYDMGDIIKGSVTRDPDGFPLLYSGSRANFHILATDRDSGQAESLWSMSADNVSPTKWNNDWDSSPLVIDDHLFQGGENGWFYIIKLNRQIGDDGKVTVDPQHVFHAPGWDDQLTSDLAGSGSRVNDVSIENSLAVSGNTLYFSNSGGLVQGWDLSGLKDGQDPERTFRFWSGDDTDASIVVDEEGMLYVSQEIERGSSSARTTEVGALVKLDPSKPDDPIVWSVADPHGIWATPAVTDEIVIVPTHSGRTMGIDRATGEVLWEKKYPSQTWSSPVVVDDVWIQGDCEGILHAYDLSDPRVDPPELWNVQLEGCIESTPAVFQGRIFVGARGGAVYGIGDPD